MRKQLILGILFLTLTSYTVISFELSRADKTTYKQVRPTASNIQHLLMPIDIKDYSKFETAVGQRESSNNYGAINQFGYIGKYQFGRLALEDVGIEDSKEFLNNPLMQDEAFLALCKVNKYRLRKFIDKYVGDTINGIQITESGLIAAAHLVGAGSVKKYLRSKGKKIRKDGNGISLEHYIKLFNNYDLQIIAEKSIKVAVR